MRKQAILAAFAAVLGLAVLAGATGYAEAAGLEVSFSLKEQKIITDFYAGGSSGGGGGGKGNKGKKGKEVGNQGLPPGLAKKQTLPPGIAKRQLPSGLLAQLPPPPTGFERVIVDDNVLLVEVATQVVHDVLEHVLSK